jgi:hypothetical protein
MSVMPSETFLEKAPFIPFSSKNGWGRLTIAVLRKYCQDPQRIISILRDYH